MTTHPPFRSSLCARSLSALQRGAVGVLALSALTLACGSDQKQPATQEEVANGEAIPEPPPAPEPAPTPAAATADPAPPTAPPTPAMSSPPAKETLSEAQAAMIADLANSSEVEQGKLAQGKAKAAAVKKFADMMVKHHSDAKQEQTKLFKKLSLTPADSSTAAGLKADGEKSLEKLRNADAASFDATYVESQVEAHQKVLDAIDSQLLPAAKDPTLVDGFKKMRATVEAHLAEAKSLQAQTHKK